MKEDMIDKRRTQIRLPEEVYFEVRHVAAATETSFNGAIISLLREALADHREQIPTLQSSRSEHRQEID